MDSIFKYIWLVPMLPLLGFFINGLFRNKLTKSISGFIGSIVVLAAFIISLLTFFAVKGGEVSVQHYFDLVRIKDFTIAFDFQVDQLTSLFLLVITGIGFLIHVYSAAYMHEEEGKNFAKYFAYLNLFVFSMLILVLGGNYVILFIGWEGVGLCSYLLIGYWFTNKEYTNAAKKAFIMNRIGDLGFLLAVFLILQTFGTVSFNELFSGANAKLAPSAGIDGKAIGAITLLLFLAATGKSAQIPLFTWLPDAMAGPTPVSALIHAATMVTAGIYLIARSNIMFSLAPFTQDVIMWVGVATAFLAATIATQQNDIKKVLAYSTVSQLGFMFLALGTGNYVAAVFHVITHAFFKALMFLGSGSVIHGMHHQQDITKMGGLKAKMKITYFTFLIGCLAIAGLPPFSGFFSKDAILMGALEHNKIVYGIALLTALLTAYYMFRLLFITFFGKFRGSQHDWDHVHESPAAMTIPLIVLALLSAIGGLINVPQLFGGNNWLSNFLKPIINQTHATHLTHTQEYVIMSAVVALIIGVIIFTYTKFKNYQPSQLPAVGLNKFLQNKWYVDELYEGVVVKPLLALGKFLNNIVEGKGIDGFVNGVGKAVNFSSRQIRLMQTGQISAYALLMVVGILLIFIIQLFL
jgi:NADH-quinone oxidoreductase subunit L